MVNGYYSGYLGEEMSVDELAAGVRHHYENGLSNIAPFMEAHDDVLPPEALEEARAKAHEAGLPFYERPYNGEDIDPYVYDGNMSIEDYELMQRLIEQDKERSERVNEVFSIQLHNRQLYEQGKDGVWLDMATTTEQLQAALTGQTAAPVRCRPKAWRMPSANTTGWTHRTIPLAMWPVGVPGGSCPN